MLFRQLVLLACSGLSTVLAGPVQNQHLVLPRSATAHQQAVSSIFLQSYAAYKYAALSEPHNVRLTRDWSGSSHLAMTILSQFPRLSLMVVMDGEHPLSMP